MKRADMESRRLDDQHCTECDGNGYHVDDCPNARAATKTGPCGCDECRQLCGGRPGIFAPQEVEPAAAELGLTLAEFFTGYCTINWWSPDGDDYEGWDHISPAWTPDSILRPLFLGFGSQIRPYSGESNAGRRCEVSDGYTRGPCALLGSAGCMLSFDRRPEECRRAYGCGRDADNGMSLHREVAEKWLAPEAVTLLGRVSR